MSGGGHGGGAARLGTGLAAAEELEEVEGILPLPSPQAERQRGGLATAARWLGHGSERRLALAGVAAALRG